MCGIHQLDTENRIFYWLSQSFEKLSLKKEVNLVYENQIPNLAVLVIRGSVRLPKKEQAKVVIESPTLIALKELLNEKPVHTDVFIEAGSEVFFINRSLLIKRLKEENKDHQIFFKPVL